MKSEVEELTKGLDDKQLEQVLDNVLLKMVGKKRTNPIKTYKEEFDIESLLSNDSDNEALVPIKTYRNEMFMRTEESRKFENKIKDILNKIKDLSSDEASKKILHDLEVDLTDQICYLETACFDRAYQDGMADLMTAITLNRADVTDIQYVDC